MRLRFSTLFVTAIVFAVASLSYSQEHREVPNKAATVTTRPSAITLRLGTSAVVIPAPVGYEEASSQFEGVKARFSETEAPGNEMLAVHLMSSDCDLLRSGQQATMQQYTKISVLRTAKELPFSQAELASVVAEFRKNGASMLDPSGARMKALLEHLEQGLKNTGSNASGVDMTQPVNMGEFEVSPNIYSVMLLLQFKSSAGQATPVLAGMSYMRVQQRLVYVFTYRKYTSRSDVETLRTFAKTWTANILAAN